MADNPLKDKKIISAVTNDLFRDRRMIRICSALSDFGANVTLIGIKKKNSQAVVNTNFSIHRFRIIFKSGILFYLEYNIKLFFYLLFKEFDIVNANDADTLLACFLATKIKNKKIVFDAHEYFTGVPELKNRNFKKGIWKTIEDKILPNIDKNYTVSDSVKNAYERDIGTSFLTIRNFPDSNNFNKIIRPNIDSKGDIYLGYVGVLNKGRGLEQAIRILQKFENRVKLILIGGGDLEKELKSLVDKLNLKSRVEFSGWVQPKQIPDILSKVHIGLNLLDGESENYKYSLANKVFDYLHMGIPCLTMNFLEYKKINDEYECFILTDNLDTDVNYHLLNELINDTEKYEELSNNSFLAAREFDWNIEKEKLLKIFK